MLYKNLYYLYLNKMGYLCPIKGVPNSNNTIGNINIEEKIDEKLNLQYAKEDTCLVPGELIDILNESVVRIEIKNPHIISSGFFIKIKLKMKEYKFLLTCDHSIPQEIIDSKTKIKIFYGRKIEEIKKKIILNSNQRFIKKIKNFDATIIQIKEEDNIYENRFLHPDLNYKMGLEHYLDSQVYTAGYQNEDIYKRNKNYSTGIIKQISKNEYTFFHTCDMKEGSSGGPIINYDKLVIGINFGNINEKKVNAGTFIGQIIKKLFLEEKNINLLMKEDNKEDDKEDGKENGKEDDNEFEKRLYNVKPGEKIYSIIFYSSDQRINYSMACKNTDIFARLEEKLYEVFPEYKDMRTYFSANGKLIKRFKNLDENGIQNNNVVLLSTEDD